MQRTLTRAQILAEQYAQGKTNDAAGLVDPSLNPVWKDRDVVPSPPRRDGSVPRILSSGSDPDTGRTIYGVEQSSIPDGGGDSPPTVASTGEDAFLQSCREELFTSPAVKHAPTFKAGGSQEGVDLAALNVAAQISKLIEQSPDEAFKMFRVAVGHKMTGFLIYGQLPEAVQNELSSMFFRIISRKPWVFTVCRMLLSLQGASSLPQIFRACCSLGASHAFLSYSDVVSPFGRLEDIALDTAGAEEAREADEDLATVFGGLGPDREATPEEVLRDTLAGADLKIEKSFQTGVVLPDPNVTPQPDEQEDPTQLRGSQDGARTTDELNADPNALEDRVQGATDAMALLGKDFTSEELAELTVDELDELSEEG